MYHREPPIPTKSRLNTRMPLSDRITPIQGSGARSLLAAVSSPTHSATSEGAEGTFSLPRRNNTDTTYTSAMISTVRSAADVPPRAGARGALGGCDTASAASAAPFSPLSTQKATYTGGAPLDAVAEATSFYSRVRRLERIDAQQQLAATGRGSQRVVDVGVRRETDPAFHPPPTVHRSHSSQSSSSSQCSSPAKRQGNAAETTASDVRCTILVRPSTQQLEYRPPAHRIPADLPPFFATQRRAVTNAASGIDLLQGTAKASADVAPGFMGHVPAHPRNVARLLGDGGETLRPYSKCSINLASSKGVQSAKRVCNRSPASIASTVMGFYSLEAVSAGREEKAVNQRM